MYLLRETVVFKICSLKCNIKIKITLNFKKKILFNTRVTIFKKQKQKILTIVLSILFLSQSQIFNINAISKE